jgi:C4-dicarboxylate transporter DctQ subunit
MPFLSWLEKHFEEIICCSCIAIIACCVFLQVLARYVFNVAVHWTEEVSAFAMVWAVYMGAALCVRERFHIRIIVGVRALPQALGRYVIYLADILWVFFCVFMLKVSFEYLGVLWKFTATTPSLGINEIYPQSILVIGYALMLIRIVQVYLDWNRKGRVGLPGMLETENSDLVDNKEPLL